MFTNFEEETRKILNNAKKECKLLKHEYIGTEHLLLAILNDKNDVRNKLNDYGIDYKKFKEEVINIIGVGNKEEEVLTYTPLLKRIIENVILENREFNKGDISLNNLFIGLLDESDGVAIRILLEFNIDIDELYSEFNNSVFKIKKENKKLLLDELGTDLTLISEDIDPVIGRENEIKRILEILSRKTKNNPLLVGEAGVGKTSIVEYLGKMISKKEVPSNLRNKRLISLDMASIVAGTKYRGEFEEKLKKIIDEVEENNNIILFIDEIHTLVGAGGAEGAIDASNIFKPALARNKLRCIGATTNEEYKKFIEKDKALDRRFQKVLIEEPKDIKNILMKLKPIYESYHNVIVDEEIINLIINLSNKYIHNRYEPDKSIDILDEVCASVSLKENKKTKEYYELEKKLKEIIKNKNNAILNNNFKNASKIKEEENNTIKRMNKLELNIKKSNNIVTPIDVANVINFKTDIPVYELLKDNTKIINDIDKKLKNIVIGQNEALNKMKSLAKKIKLGYNNKCISLLFVGPSGVGKTLLATKFGELMNINILRLDMTEYTEAHSVSKIIGSPPGYVGYDDSKNVLDEIRNNSHTVLILDEIEKAHPDVINLFMQILDNGKIKDSSSKTIYFNHVIIIMTSNIGYLENKVGFVDKKDKYVTNKLKNFFSIPFINRIDDIVIFNHLIKDDIEMLVTRKIKKLKNEYNIKISKNVIDEIISLSNYDEFGARKIDKLISRLENIMIEKTINNDMTMINSLEKSIV